MNEAAKRLRARIAEAEADFHKDHHQIGVHIGDIKAVLDENDRLSGVKGKSLEELCRRGKEIKALKAENAAQATRIIGLEARLGEYEAEIGQRIDGHKLNYRMTVHDQILVSRACRVALMLANAGDDVTCRWCKRTHSEHDEDCPAMICGDIFLFIDSGEADFRRVLERLVLRWQEVKTKRLGVARG